jgi:CheY-like chemotaxis protein
MRQRRLSLCPKFCGQTELPLFCPERSKEEATGAHVPIVAMSASAMSEDRDRCLTAGMDDFISKPVSYKGIKQVITAKFSTRK